MTLQTIIDSDGSCLAGVAMNAKLRDRWSEMFRAKTKESQLSESFTKQWCQEIGSAKVTIPGRVSVRKVLVYDIGRRSLLLDRARIPDI